MATYPIALLRDNFENGSVIAPLYTTAFTTIGSATRAQTGGQMIMTLPSATAGTHQAGIQTAGTYDLTGDQVSISVGTMVNTAVAATAALTVFDSNDTTTWVRFAQLSGNLNFQQSVAGVITTIGTAVAWSATTHKYWRIRESAGTIYLDTSTSASAGVAWTNRGSVTAALSFVPTAVLVRVDAVCGNVATPGSFRIDELNSSYPATTATWRYTTADWSISNRLRPVTLASDGSKLGVIVTADTMDSAGVLGGTVRYFAGPLGSASGGYLQATEYTTLALAQASPFQVPVNGRIDLPTLVDARYTRLYHRSSDALTHLIYEYVPRRIVQAEDIEAESIRAINIAAGAITADKIFVLNLAALSASMGALHMDGVIDIVTTGGLYQGTGTFAAPTTGLKLFNVSGIGKLSTYNAGVEQVTFDTDGKLKAGAGAVVLDSAGIGILSSTIFDVTRAYSFRDGTAQIGGVYAQGNLNAPVLLKIEADASANPTNGAGQVIIQSRAAAGLGSKVNLVAIRGATQYSFGIDIGIYDGFLFTGAPVTMSIGLNVGTATSAGTGEIKTSGSVAFGNAVNGTVRLTLQSAGTTSGTYLIYANNSTPTNEFYVRSDGAGFINAAAWTYASDGRLKERIVKSDRGLAHLKRLEAMRFDYINGQKNQIGFLAEAVQAVLPELVVPIDANDTSATPMLGMMTTSLIPILVSAVQELDARIAALETQKVLKP